MASTETLPRRLSHVVFESLEIPNVMRRDIESAVRVIFENQPRAAIGVARLTEALTMERAPVLSTRDLEQLGLEQVSYDSSCCRSGSTCLLTIQFRVPVSSQEPRGDFTLQISRDREHSITVKFSMHPGSEDAFALALRAARGLGFAGFIAGVDLDERDGVYRIPGTEQPHTLCLYDANTNCAC